MKIQVDILDTSGDMQFPAMRRLSLATANAFLIVFATTSAPSFGCVKQCFEEIREQRADFQVILFTDIICNRQIEIILVSK